MEEKYLIMYIIDSSLRKIKIKIVWININKIWNIEVDVCTIFKTKYGVNRMHPIIFSHQVRWFDSKGIDIHPWGLMIKHHKWHSCGQRYVGMLTVYVLHS